MVDIMRNGIERAVETRNLVMRVQWVGVIRIAQAKRPGQRRRDSPGVLNIEIQIEEIKRFVGRRRECLRCRGCHAVYELWQRRIGDRWDRTLPEIVIIQPKDSDVRAKSQFVSAVAPGKIVIDKESCGAPALNPSVVESSDGGERGVGTAALKHDGERRERFLEVSWPEQALIPRERRIEVVHQILRE